ncbi:MAG: Flavin reductase like domain protein [Methanomassiliicoccales archaeon PtaU1.Bin124]|nr:MAG: Flavin reductase like domain protein [Methanomassiliicoccales archaeon PtaU1.Bin124]
MQIRKANVLEVRVLSDIMKRSLGAKTLLFPTPVMVVGTFDMDGKPNVMTAAWGGICCSDPPSLAVSIRRSRLTYQNLVAKGDFTVSIPSERYVAEVDYFGIAGGRNEDKFHGSGLTAAKAEHVDAPFVKEFPMHLECRVRHMLDLGQHTQFIGEIMDVKVDSDLVDDGIIDVARLQPFWYAPGTSEYFGTGENLGRGFTIGKKLSKK